MSGLELYMQICGTEVWNQERTAAYAAAGVTQTGVRCVPCGGLADLLPCVGDRPPELGYRLPELDPAPWYDPKVPESKDFAGLMVLEAQLSSSLDRRLVQNVGHGSVLTRARFAGRTMQVRGVLLGRTCCANDYGMKWLTQALLGDFCESCEGCDLTFFSCCPASRPESECLVLYEGDTPVPYFRESDSSEWSRGADFIRTMCGAGLISGPEIVACHGLRGAGGCCGLAPVVEVEFTIGIGNPWMHRPGRVLYLDALLGGCPLNVCNLEFDGAAECVPDPDVAFSDCPCRLTFDDSDTCDPTTLCPEPPDCADDPSCPPVMKPPRTFAPPQDCGCLPLVVGRNCFEIPPDADWFEQVLIVEVYAGSEPLENMTIRAIQNPRGLRCCDDENQEMLDDCLACATLLISYVPAYGTFRFDSRCREVTLTCNGRTRPAGKNVARLDGLPFEWIELGCTGACLTVDADCGHTAVDATITIEASGREL